MKKRTINSVICKKVDSWIESIQDPEVKNLVKENIIVTGGCIASMFLGEQVNDFDIYFRNRQTTEAVVKYYLEKFNELRVHNSQVPVPIFYKIDPLPEAEHTSDQKERIRIYVKSAGVASENDSEVKYRYFEQEVSSENAERYVQGVMGLGENIDIIEEEESSAQEVPTEEKFDYRPVFLSSNAITLSGKIQIIVRFYGSPENIHSNYDFVHCTGYWTSWERKVQISAAALEALITRELIYVGSRYPVCSLFRIRKFVKRGWSVTAAQMLKAILQVSELDLKDVEVLEDQLTGVDVAYFTELLNKLKDRKDENGNPITEIPTSYLLEILNRLY